MSPASVVSRSVPLPSALRRCAERADVVVHVHPLPGRATALLACKRPCTVIAISPALPAREAVCAVAVLLGLLLTAAGDVTQLDGRSAQKALCRARAWAYACLVPRAALLAALSAHPSNADAAAESLGVTTAFFKAARRHHRTSRDASQPGGLPARTTPTVRPQTRQIVHPQSRRPPG